MIRRSLSTILLQETAVDLLASGKTGTDTAKAIEVTGRL
jgi:hypothetical protein